MWIAFAEHEELRDKSPDVAQILEELGLLSRVLAPDAVTFWDSLRHAGRHVDQAILKKIGDEAESLSIEFERSRLLKNGFSGLASQIRWVSRESDLHGYDILSFRGEEPSPENRIHIEVKSLSTRPGDAYYFHLSRNEKDQLDALGDSYFFHLWKPSRQGRGESPLILPGSEVGTYAPKDSAHGGRWTACTIDVPRAEASRL